jgi:hypothetical protein
MPIIAGARQRGGVTDDTGVAVQVFTFSGAPVNGGSGTFVNVAEPGALLVRIDAGQIRLYINTNTKASPTWTVVGTQT